MRKRKLLPSEPRADHEEAKQAGASELQIKARIYIMKIRK